MAQARKQRSWLLRPLAPATHSCVLPPLREETAAGKLHMETMGSVFSTCAVRPAQDVAGDGVPRGGEGLAGSPSLAGARLGGGWLDELKLLFCPLSSKHQLKPRNPVV